jgi:hypothetical protein
MGGPKAAMSPLMSWALRPMRWMRYPVPLEDPHPELLYSVLGMP